ncbi:tetratricopeptide repeat protein [Parasphingorhabdus flavimaris]|uniref:Tetratricopeptide repeat protein n=1 Tax=Parasphingorhabdus flavimaris TaxID=266812 RepID=A0ABX2N0C2_9SPHN|nr:tetratricopeptide repeat protein [Parasphingorhabdus flavimaris]NVD27145.1 tetratricopeptide repeat protein [Parasphingorhabdus flavimaris]|tara:strand:+ start:15704 stop:17677 length:1974 start_codon:yes stop_codon:yes gene_type:complete
MMISRFQQWRLFSKPVVLATMLAVSVVGIPSAIFAASEGNGEAREAFAKAEQFRAQRDIRSARIELMNAIKADPEWIDARVAQAEVLLGLYDGIAAEAEIDRAISLGLDPARVRHLLGHALFLQGKPQKARDQLMADDIPARHQGYAARIMGKLALQMGDGQLASQSFNRAMELDRQNPDLWVDIARFRADSGDQAGATNAVDEAVKLDPDNIRALQYRGELLRFQFGLGASLPWFERALEIDPNDVPLLTEYAATLGDMGRMTEMLAIARKIISLDSRNPRAFFMQAVLAARAGKYGLARRLMHQTGGAMDNVPAVLLVQGIIEHGEGNYNAAVDKFGRLVSIQPSNRQAQNLLARSLYLAGSALDAVEVLKPQVNRTGADPYALWLAGRGLEAIDERVQAAGVLNRAAVHDSGKESAIAAAVPLGILSGEAQRNPNDARAVVPYIRALYDAGDLATAYAEAKRLQNGNPGASDAHILVADVAAAMGNYDEALDALGQARSIRFSEPVMLRLVEVTRAKGALQQSGETVAQFLNYNPSNIAGLRWMAYAHLETGSWSVAVHLLENLRKRLGENDALIMAGLTQAYTGLGETEKAIAAGRIAYRVQPSSPVVSHLYGLALLADEGRIGDATSLLEKAVTIMPENPAYRASLRRARAI